MNTPATDALVNKHFHEEPGNSEYSDDWVVSENCVAEFIAHARSMESERDTLREQVKVLREALSSLLFNVQHGNGAEAWISSKENASKTLELTQS